MRPPQSIPRLHAHPNGRYYWKPEKKLRPHWKAVPLGAAAEAAKAEARRLNREADAWWQARLAFGAAGAAAGRAPKVRLGPRTVGQVIGLFKASPAWRALAPKTRESYAYELRRLEDEFGHEVAGTLDEARVDDWADELRETSPETLRHVCGRGRALYEWAARKKHVPRGHNPFKGVELGGGNKRRFRFLWPDVLHILAVSIEEGRPSVGVALVVAFVTVQRVTDVLGFDDAIVVRPAPVLVDGVEVHPPARLQFVQSKKAAARERALAHGEKAGHGFGSLPGEIDMRMPAIVAEILMRHPPLPTADKRNVRPWIVSEETGLPYPVRTASRVFARVLAVAIAKDPKRWKHLAGGQLRDGRRSGFVHRIVAGATIPQVCAISGHTLEEGYAIVEHYLPRTPELADQAEQFLQVSL